MLFMDAGQGATHGGWSTQGGDGGTAPSRQDAPRQHRRVPRLILASQSPRRRQLLTEHGLDHDALNPGVDDGLLTPGSVTPEQWVRALAYYKAAAGARAARPTDNLPRLVLGADTVCVVDGRIMSHPADAEDARRMLGSFMGREHEVLTGVALIPLTNGQADTFDRLLFVDAAKVRWGQIADGDLDAYLASGQWRGKAGGYNLAERLAAGWPITYDGDPTTIMGLPMARLLEALERLVPDLASPTRDQPE